MLRQVYKFTRNRTNSGKQVLTIRLGHWSIPNETFRSSKTGHGSRWSSLQIVIISTDFLDSHSTEHHRVAANNFNKSKLISTNITSRVSRLWRHRKIATMRTVIGKTGNCKVFRERMYTVVRKYVDTLVDYIYISINSIPLYFFRDLRVKLLHSRVCFVSILCFTYKNEKYHLLHKRQNTNENRTL